MMNKGMMNKGTMNAGIFHIVWTIIRKELLDTLRDHRTIVTMLVVPLAIVPISVFMLGKVNTGHAPSDVGIVRIGIVSHGNAQDFEWTLRKDERALVVRLETEGEAQKMVQSDRLDAAVVFDSAFDTHVASLQPAEVSVLYSHYGSAAERRRVQEFLRDYEQELVSARFASLSAPSEWARALRLDEREITRADDVLQRLLAGLLPYIVIIFCFLGCMYPALDLGAGEKERKTMETLLSSPASRLEIALGKFAVVTIIGYISACVALLAVLIGLLPHAGSPSSLVNSMWAVFAPGTLPAVLLLILPLTMFFAAVLLAVSVYARSFKEAQSIITPLTFVAIFPAGLALVPSINLGTATAAVPVLNVSLAMKAVATGDLTIVPVLVALTTLMLFAFVAVRICAGFFEREAVVFRG